AVSGLAYDREGRRLASCSVDHLVKIWNVIELAADPITLTGHGGPLSSVAFSPDGRSVVSAGSDPLVKVWDIQNRNELRSFGGDKNIKVWDAATGKELRTITGPENSMYAIMVSPDNKQVIAWVAKNEIQVYGIETGKRVKPVLQVHEGSIECLAFSPDGELAV